MSIKRILVAATVIAAATSVANAQQASPENYLRSSLYTILITSPTQDGELVEETQKIGESGALLKSLSKNNNSSDPSEIIKAPQAAFLSIAIPDQFNDHNLYFRGVEFDTPFQAMTDEDKAEAISLSGKKKGGGLLGFAKSAAGISNYPTGGNIDSYGPWVLDRMFKQNHIADSIVAKWYGYDPQRADGQLWDPNFTLIYDRGFQGSSEAEKAEAAQAGLSASLMQQRGMDLVPNTYVLAVNFRFRSNQAIVAEAEAASNAVGGMFGNLGSLVAKGAAMAGSAIAGEGFTVQAHTYLFKLDWNNDINNQFAEQIWAQNKSLEDLMASGLCKLVYVGHEKSGSRVRQSLTSKTSQAELVQTATARAIDEAIAKLQVKYEGFRTSFPVFKDNGDGTITARVGMKEGISKGDEYEILEAQIDPQTNQTIYKPVGKVKALDKKIWDNRVGIAEEVADGEENPSAALGYTTFTGAKKGQNYEGYYLRLKKKK